MNHLIRLLARNKGKGFFKVEASADEATIYLYDAIVSDEFFGGVSATAFVKELAAMNAPTIHLRINCPGGDVFAARAIEQAIKEHPSTVIAHIDGYAASAASYVALAADEVIMAEGAMYMIHKAWTMAMGNADDLMETAGLLEKVDAALIATYASATGQEPKQIEQWMTDETWFTAEEAVKFGFADKCAAPAKKKKAQSQWDLSAYTHAPVVEDAQEDEDEEIPIAHVITNTDHLRRKVDLILRT